MGRTVPSIRMVVEREARKLERMRGYAHTRLSKMILDDMIAALREYSALFQAVPPDTPEEALLIASLIKIYERLLSLEEKLDVKGEGPGGEDKANPCG